MGVGKTIGAAAVIAAIGVYLNNASWLAPDTGGPAMIYAHRGPHQQYERADLTNETCTAARMTPSGHRYLENTIGGVAAAFALGADRVEIDIQPTRDGDWAVFHDAGLACRTNGVGTIRERTMEELRLLDVGYGYTSDDGRTFPFRGLHIGAMPSLSEMLLAFPSEQLELHVKGGDADDADALRSYLDGLGAANPSRLSIYSTPLFEARWREIGGGVPVFGKHQASACVKSYLLTGWTGRLPRKCANGIIAPIDLAFLYWGWPDRLLARFAETPGGVMVIGPALKPDGSRAVDALDELARLPTDWSGWVYTNRIDLIGPAVRGVDEMPSGVDRAERSSAP